ncbi:hypothetical protein J1C67_00030 [Clostridium gasigenes]|uniref:DarT1-associated NADAR antitoxin family protein n=1 Tax=Clostridium gasigenes TaxID=94869 RepID=UPI0014384128|nr:hypothetical protein [Clostridium gasigenes]NKF07115.1 hypothetical protein [Clostridium gasigenes]QSW19634.1 hypothetical protein J1C67_00030 [Clostridium gasigenes]
MASRPAWTIRDNKIVIDHFDFKWNGGFSVVQKQKNIVALHESIKEKHNSEVLEVSSKSENELGENIGAFNLKSGDYYLENIFQAAKKYENGGPFIDLLNVLPRDAKRDERHGTSGDLFSFIYKEEEWLLEPKTAFYDFIYIRTLVEAHGKEIDLAPFQWFTDIEFNPKKSINCQARSVVIYKLLKQLDKFYLLESKDKWIEFHKQYVVG